MLQPGDRHPLGIGAGSLAILASLPDHEVAEMIAANAAEFAARYTAFSPALLQAEIARTRARGYALNTGLLQHGSWGVGVAVLDQQGRCEGALSIAAIESRLDSPRRDQMAVLLQTEAERLAGRLARPAGMTDRSAVPKRRAAARN